jgi:hypothetical protein
LYGGEVKTWVEVERKLDLKEEALDLNQLGVVAKTRESARERVWHKMELPLTELEQSTLDDHTSLVFIPLG